MAGSCPHLSKISRSKSESCRPTSAGQICKVVRLLKIWILGSADRGLNFWGSWNMSPLALTWNRILLSLPKNFGLKLRNWSTRVGWLSRLGDYLWALLWKHFYEPWMRMSWKSGKSGVWLGTFIRWKGRIWGGTFLCRAREIKQRISMMRLGKRNL